MSSWQQRILIVEDDPDQAMLFAQVLSLYHYQVVTVATAEEAVEQLAASPFALLLADWDLPGGGMHGDALISLVKTRFPGVKTVLYSNHAHVKAAADAAGADACFRKFEGIHKLRELVNALLPLHENHETPDYS